ncbi:MAG: hypothetical protein AAF716_14550 [Cyanobacteria bacterium P01_D01_bin.1]
MSLESIALIGVLTLLTLVLGSDLFLLFIGRPALEAVYLEFFNSQAYWTMTWRLGSVLFFLCLGAITLNLTPATRIEAYLLRIGLGSLLFYLLLFLVSSLPVSYPLTAGLRDRILESANSDTPVTSWYKTWTLLLWPRAMAALVSFWSFLHYAMNPKI